MKTIKITSRYSSNKISQAQGNLPDIEQDICYKDQLSLLNNTYMNNTNNKLTSSIKKKIQGYKQQDSKWQERSECNIISFDDTLEKLVCSKLKCYYCSKEIKLIYNMSREPMQWTLDRINNDIGHTCDNTVIACMRCNLQRRRKGADIFKFTKSLKIQKQT
tara:strand:- start:36 stop:518 length:483 start_codon:yes stop_codon:yes gene_type:complete